MYLDNPDGKKEAGEEDQDEDKNKERMINQKLLPLHARGLKHTAIGCGGGGLVWRVRGLEEYSFSSLRV